MSQRLEQALAAIDAANAADPNEVVVDGVARPKELLHAERMTHWLHVLAPSPTEAQLLAARAHHIRRWVSPRDTYPAGRAGYHRWRRDQRERQAHEVGELLSSVGYERPEIEQVQAIVAKEGLGRDPLVQVHEDALCLVFLELQFDELALQLGDEHTIRVVRRTARKMSPAGLAATSAIGFTPRCERLLAAALDSLGEPDGSPAA
ncbi:MAG: DUF4202 domain-containing protein [Acidimicrobiales bacterium]